MGGIWPSVVLMIILLILGALIGCGICRVMTLEPPEWQTEREEGLIMVEGRYIQAIGPVNFPNIQVTGVNAGWNDKMAYAIMMAESGGEADAINWDDYHKAGDCWGSYGLFQLSCFRGTPEELLDPDTNIRIAYELWQNEGWHPWGAYADKSYLKFLVP